jgi:LytS/YehU family sensor histidine kinase
LQQQDLREHATRAEVRALRAQINPHFLFNALNAIAGWIRVRPELADETVTQLAEVFRYALNRSQQEWVRLGEELDFIRSYLAVEQARFGDRLVVSIESDPGVEGLQVPTMLIQPLVENALKHGLKNTGSGGELSVAVKDAGNELIIEVSDNGESFPSDMLAGYGLQSISDKIQLLYDNKGSVNFVNSPRKMAVVRLPKQHSA